MKDLIGLDSGVTPRVRCRKAMSDLHMRCSAESWIFWIYSQEIQIQCFYVAATSFVKHMFQSSISLLVSFKSIELGIDM